MYISGINAARRDLRSRALGMLAASAGVFGANLLYSIFAHGVDSAYMTYAFAYLLALSALFAALSLFAPKVALIKPYRFFLRLSYAAAATLCCGSFIHGVLAIAGTDSGYLVGYTAAGVLLAALALSALIAMLITPIKKYGASR